jgi:hypothetical protein
MRAANSPLLGPLHLGRVARDEQLVRYGVAKIIGDRSAHSRSGDRRRDEASFRALPQCSFIDVWIVLPEQRLALRDVLLGQYAVLLQRREKILVGPVKLVDLQCAAAC